MTDPGSAYRLKMGTQELDNRLRAGGKFYSGAALRGGQELSQGLATQDLTGAWNRNAALAGIGQTATQNTGTLSTGANLAAGINSGGASRASGYVGLGNAVNNGLNSYNTANNNDQLMALFQQAIANRG